MAPNRLPWSVRASAGKRSSLARATSLSSWAAPSRRLYSEWTCRWTKSEWVIALPWTIREDAGPPPPDPLPHEGEGGILEPSPPLTLPLPGGERRRGEGHLSRAGGGGACEGAPAFMHSSP